MRYKFAIVFSFGAVVAEAQTAVAPVLDEPTFHRYATAWECARASAWSENRFWRDKRPDTLDILRTGNSTQPSTVQRVRQCMARLNVSSIAPRDMVGLIQAFLMAEHETQAEASAAKLLALESSPPAKAWALYQIIDLYLSAARPNIQAAAKYLAALDAMDADAAIERMLAHRRFARTARFRDSVPLWERELSAALAASKYITGDTRKQYAYELAGIYLDIADLKGRMNDPAAAILAIETARAELVPLRPSLAPFLQDKEVPYRLLGQIASTVKATQWYNTHGNDVRPLPGRITLLVHVSHSCGSRCYQSYAVLKRLRAKFEAKGLDIVLMTQTQGYYRNRLVKSDSEMTDIDGYFRKEIQLPISLAVWQTEFRKRTDGKLLALLSPNAEAYRGEAFIVGRHGTIRYVAPAINVSVEAILEDIITSLL